jgi:hypothetical protein
MVKRTRARAALVALSAAFAIAPFATPMADATSIDAQQLLGDYKCYICHSKGFAHTDLVAIEAE